MRAERVVVGFDSATALLRDLSSHLSGARVPPGRTAAPVPAPLGASGAGTGRCGRDRALRIHAVSVHGGKLSG